MALVTITTVPEKHCPICAKRLSGMDSGPRPCSSCRFRWGGEPPIIVIRIKGPWVSQVVRLAAIYEQAMRMDPWPSPETAAHLAKKR